MSTLQVDTILAKDGTQTTEPSIPALDKRMAAAWVNFDGTAASIVPRDGYNVASITDNGTGNYTVNFTAPMPHANYAVAGTARDDDAIPTTVIGMAQASAKTTGACGIVVTEVTFAIVDSADVNVIVFA